MALLCSRFLYAFSSVWALQEVAGASRTIPYYTDIPYDSLVRPKTAGTAHHNMEFPFRTRRHFSDRDPAVRRSPQVPQNLTPPFSRHPVALGRKRTPSTLFFLSIPLQNICGRVLARAIRSVRLFAFNNQCNPRCASFLFCFHQPRTWIPPPPYILKTYPGPFALTVTLRTARSFCISTELGIFSLLPPKRRQEIPTVPLLRSPLFIPDSSSSQQYRLLFLSFPRHGHLSVAIAARSGSSSTRAVSHLSSYITFGILMDIFVLSF